MSIEQLNANLAQIRHFQLHPELLPHVGQHYDEYRILLIGESHYLPTKDVDYGDYIDVFKNWYEDKLEHIPGVSDDEWEKDRSYFNTRNLITGFFNGEQHNNSFLAIPNKLFIEVMSQKAKQTKSNSLFSYCAFFNYFQRPHLREKEGFSFILPDEAKKTYNIVSEAITALNPLLVLFISTKASRSYVLNKYSSYENCSANVFFHLKKWNCDNGKEVPVNEYQEHLFGHPLRGILNREEIKRVLSEYLKSF